MSRAASIALLGSIGSIVCATAAVQASVGAGVGATPLTLPGLAEPGASYRLPDLYVVNTGSAASDYSVRVQRIATDARRRVPARWIRMDRTAFRLKPRGTIHLSVRLMVPRDAPAGRYLTNLVAATTSRPRPHGGTALGAAAAAQLSFEVRGKRSLARRGAYVALALCCVLLVLARVRLTHRRS